MRLAETLALIYSDCQRINRYGENKKLTIFKTCSLLLRPEISALVLYRLSHWCHTKKRFGLARLLFHANIFFNGAELYPSSIIGAGCLLVHPVGTSIFGTIGKDATILSHVVIGSEEIGCPLEKAPVIGDCCIASSMVSILGTVAIGNQVTIAPCSLIEHSITDHHCLVSRMPESDYIVKRHTTQDNQSSDERKLRTGE